MTLEMHSSSTASMADRSSQRAQFLLNGAVYDGDAAPSLPPKAKQLAKVKTGQRQHLPPAQMAPLQKKKPLPPSAPATSRSGAAVCGDDEGDDESDDDDEDDVADALGTPVAANSELWSQVESFLSKPAPSLGASTATSARLPSLAASGADDAMVARLRQERSALRKAGAGAQAPAPPSMPRAARGKKGGTVDEALLAEAFAYADNLRAQEFAGQNGGGAAAALGGGGGGMGAAAPSLCGSADAPRRRQQDGVAQGSGARAVRGRAAQRKGGAAKKQGGRGAGGRAKGASGAAKGASGGAAKGARRKLRPSSGGDIGGGAFSGGGMCMESGEKSRERADYDALRANFEQGMELNALRAQLAASQASLNKSTKKLASEMRAGTGAGPY